MLHEKNRGNPTGEPLCGVELKKALDELFGLRRNGIPVFPGIRDLAGELLERTGAGLGGKRISAGEQEITNDAERPHVAGLGVAGALVVAHVHLGSDVVASTDHAVGILVGCEDLEGRREMHKKILWRAQSR